MRRSDRLRKKHKTDYVEPDSSDDGTSDDSDDFGDSEIDNDDDDNIPEDLINIIHTAIQGALQSIVETDTNESKQNTQCKKRKRSVKVIDSPPPIQPTDLSSLIDLCKLCEHRVYRDCTLLFDLIPPLTELNQLIGLEELKQSMVEFVLLHVQKEEITIPTMRHLIIAGPPGCGKTTVATIIGKILSIMEGSQLPKIVYGTQSNMIGGFLGQTAPKTEAVIRSAFGGVLIIDEASSLADGRSDQNSDSFSKSCIDTLNRMLSEYGDKFICILAGYKKEIFRDILSINPGMERRFSTCFEIGEYSSAHIKEIILKAMHTRNIRLDEDVSIPLNWIKKHKSKMKNTGGDCNILVDYIITCHARRMFGHTDKNTISQADLDTGLDNMSKRLNGRTASEEVPYCLQHMFT